MTPRVTLKLENLWIIRATVSLSRLFCHMSTVISKAILFCSVRTLDSQQVFLTSAQLATLSNGSWRLYSLYNYDLNTEKPGQTHITLQDLQLHTAKIKLRTIHNRQPYYYYYYYYYIQLYILKCNIISHHMFLYFYIITFRRMCAVPNMAAFCGSLIAVFVAMLRRYRPSDSETVPLAPIITGITFVFTFHMSLISTVRCLYFNIFSSSLLITFLSPHIAPSINTYVPFSLSRIHSFIQYSV